MIFSIVLDDTIAAALDTYVRSLPGAPVQDPQTGIVTTPSLYPNGVNDWLSGVVQIHLKSLSGTLSKSAAISVLQTQIDTLQNQITARQIKIQSLLTPAVSVGTVAP